MATSQRGGLGRGLAALIPDAAQLEERQLGTSDRLLHSIANSGFDLLEQGAKLGLCAYLHVPNDGDPRLWLRRPSFEALTPTRAFNLFHGMAMSTNLAEPTGALDWEGLHARYVRSRGAASDGIHFIARRSGRFDSGSQRIVDTICGAFADLAHQVQAGAPDDLPRTTVRVSPTLDDRSEARAEVHESEMTYEGSGVGGDPAEAVARAVFDAVAPTHRFVDHRILPVDDQRVVLVVSKTAEGEIRVGLSMAHGDAYTSVANAALRCVLPRGIR